MGTDGWLEKPDVVTQVLEKLFQDLGFEPRV